MGKKKTAEQKEKKQGSIEDNWFEKLREAIESSYEHTKVTVQAKTLYKELGLKDNVTVYDIIVVSPAFQDHDYEERLSMIWPIFAKIPDSVYRQIYGVDCQTPAEHHRKVA